MGLTKIDWKLWIITTIFTVEDSLEKPHNERAIISCVPASVAQKIYKNPTRTMKSYSIHHGLWFTFWINSQDVSSLRIYRTCLFAFYSSCSRERETRPGEVLVQTLISDLERARSDPSNSTLHVLTSIWFIISSQIILMSNEYNIITAC